MNRRGFLSGLGALIGGIALQEAIPLGRVWSFPKEVKCLNAVPIIATVEQYSDFGDWEISPLILKMADELAFRAAKTIDVIVRQDYNYA